MKHADEDAFPLGRDKIVTRISTEVQRSQEDAGGARVYALIGPWGSGKTWILDRVIRNLRDDMDADGRDPVIEFNPWLFGSEAAIGQGFATAILARTGGGAHRRRRAAKLVQDYGPVVTPMFNGFGINAQGIFSGVAGALSDIGSPLGIRRQLEQATMGKRLIVVMDDLDRLTPEELLTVFKLLRLVGDVPTITYVLGYDEESMLQLVASSSVGAGSLERARNYMEKIIERGFLVPPLSLANLEDLVLMPIIAFGRAMDPTWSESDQEVLLFRLRELLPEFVRTPRAAHRLLDAIRDLGPELAAEVNFSDWCFTSFLRVFVPDVWHLLVRKRALLTGGSGGSLLFDEQELRNRALALRQQFEELLADRQGGAEVMSAMRRIFVGWDFLMQAGTSGGPNLDRTAQERSAGHPDFIDRYIWNALPPGSISEAQVRSALLSYSLNGNAEALIALLEVDPSRAIKAVWRHRGADGVSLTAVFQFLGLAYQRFSEVSTELDVFGVGGSTRAHASVLLTEMADDELGTLYTPQVNTRAQLALLADVLGGSTLRNLPGGHLSGWANATRDSIGAEFEQSLAEESTLDIADRAKTYLFFSVARLSSERLRLLVARMVNSGTWDPIDVAALWVHSSDSGHGMRLRGFDADQVANFLGDEMLEAMRTAAAGASDPPLSTAGVYDLSVTHENARGIVINVLRASGQGTPPTATTGE